MTIHLALAEPIIIEIVEAGIRQPSIESSEISEIEGVVVSVIKARDESDQATGLSGRRIIANGGFDGLKRFLRPVHDRLYVVLERFSPGEALAADDFAPGHVQFTCLGLV